MRLASILQQSASTARQLKFQAYVDAVKGKATEAARDGAGEVEVTLEAKAYHCRYLIGKALDEEGFNVETRYIKNAISVDKFAVKVAWDYSFTHTPTHHSKED